MRIAQLFSLVILSQINIQNKDMEILLFFVFRCWGHVPNGLILHKDQKQLIYPLGSTIVFRTLLKNHQQFLIGHENPVSCVAINEDATLLASGEEACMGFTVTEN